MPRKGQTKYKGLFTEGHMFGKYTLLDPEPKRIERKNPTSSTKHTYKYLCRCECGTEQFVDCYNLEAGVSTCCYPCGNHRNKGEGNPAWRGHRGLSGKYLSRLKRGAVKRNLEFDITVDQMCDLYEEQNKTCALSGLPITLGRDASVDRIDNEVGYAIDNIQWVHKHINFMKRTYSQEYFIEMCSKVAQNNLTVIKN
tara:strand:- start:18 stop:608 length:591 start_codon:yes stop_codon:yes gene_type:complete